VEQRLGWVLSAPFTLLVVGVAGILMVRWPEFRAAWQAVIGAAMVTVVVGVAAIHKSLSDLKPVFDLAAKLRKTLPTKQRLDDRQARATDRVEELERALRDLTAAGRLATRIADQAASDVYRGQLGTMTRIREDFEVLADKLDSALKPRPARTSLRNRPGSTGYAPAR
jgi:hypothetical protein